MAAKKKAANGRTPPGVAPPEPSFVDLARLFSDGETKDLPQEQKLRFLELLRDHRRIESWRATMDRLPELLDRGIDEWGKHCDRQSRTTWWSLLVHLGVLFFGAGTLIWLGVARVLDGSTIVALLGPLLTYVLLNLRQLTPGGASQKSDV